MYKNIFIVSFDYKNDSESYRVIVHAYTPEDALIIAEYVQDESEKYLAAKKPSSKNTLYVIDNARINRVPINMNLSKYMFVGIVLSAMVAFGICLIVELNDVRVKDEKELSEILDLPTLGVVPLYNPTNEKIKRYGYYARYKTYGYKSYGYHADNTDE